MLEIICLIWLWRVNGKHAIERGQNPKKYRALTLGLWFGLEFTGTFVGAWLMQLLNAGDNAFYGAYFFGIIGAAIGGFTSYWVAKKAPMGNYRPEDPPERLLAELRAGEPACAHGTAQRKRLGCCPVPARPFPSGLGALPWPGDRSLLSLGPEVFAPGRVRGGELRREGRP